MMKNRRLMAIMLGMIVGVLALVAFLTHNYIGSEVQASFGEVTPKPRLEPGQVIVYDERWSESKADEDTMSANEVKALTKAESGFKGRRDTGL